MSQPFEQIPRNAHGHFLLNLYAATGRLIDYLARLGEAGGNELRAMLERFAFVRGYDEEARRHMPEGLLTGETATWWHDAIRSWEQATPVHLPLRALEVDAGLTYTHRLTLLLAGLVEEDSRFGTLFAWLQEPLGHRRPTLELMGQVMRSGEGTFDAWGLFRPILEAGLVEVTNPDAPRAEWLARIPPALWNVIRGEPAVKPTPWAILTPAGEFPRIDALILPDDLLRRLAQVPALLTDGRARTLVLRSTPGSDRVQVMGAVGKAMGRDLLEVDGAAMQAAGHGELLGPLCAMANAFPVLAYDPGPGETVELPVFRGYQGPVGVTIGHEGGLAGRVADRALTLTLPTPRAPLRLRCWRESFGDIRVEGLEAIARRFHIPPGYIRQAAPMARAVAALDRRDTVRIDDVREACRALNRQQLDTLATRLEVDGGWDRLVVSPGTVTRLREVERRCRHRERLQEALSPAFSGVSRGVRALFSGASGTGKTLAARILASVLGMDLYRVDLAAVINKYIGETEKNLHKVLSRAEELDVILLLDEGDSLLGARTEVRSANDRYANLETNYLLQRLENYQGIVLITTNAAEHIDQAFQRRIDVVVSFIAPQVQERWAIWRLHLPGDHTVPDAFLESVAVRCALSGGQIRNAALHATLLGLEDTGRVEQRHLEEAIQAEYRKAGAVCPLSEPVKAPRPRGGMGAFVDRLSG